MRITVNSPRTISHADVTNYVAGFPRGIESSERVLNFKIGFQDFEKVLNLAKMCIKYRKSAEIPNSAICFFKYLFFFADVFSVVFRK